MRQSARMTVAALLAVVLGQGLLAGEARAVKQHIQAISEASAKAACKNHGGGTSCDFCHRDHCHSIGGCSKGKCYNTVYSAAPPPPKPGNDLGVVSPGRTSGRTLRPISGGLLETDTGLIRTGPAGTGTPIGPAGGGGTPSSGGAAPAAPAGGPMLR